MSHVIIRNALEIQLAAISGVPAIAYENVDYASALETPFIEVAYMPTTQPAASLGPTSQTKYSGMMLLNLNYPQMLGPQAADAMSDKVGTAFKWGTILTNAGKTITILKCDRHKALSKQPWYIVPMTVYWYAYI